MFSVEFESRILLREYERAMHDVVPLKLSCGCAAHPHLGLDVNDGTLTTFVVCPDCGTYFGVEDFEPEYAESWFEVFEELVALWCAWGSRDVPAEVPGFVVAQSGVLVELFGEFDAWQDSFQRKRVTEIGADASVSVLLH